MEKRLTDTLATRIDPAPQGKGYTLIYDRGRGSVAGFALRVTERGAKSWCVDYRIGRTSRRYTIGAYPDWKCQRARKRAAELKRMVDQGRDPMRERQEERDAETVKEAAERFEKEHLPKKAAATRRDYKSLLDNIIVPHLGKLKCADDGLRTDDIERMHRKVTEENGATRANHALRVMSKLCNLMIRWGLRQSNPCRGIERNPENKRQRYLSGEEIARLSAALAARPCSSSDAVRLLILTGARRGETLAAQWKDINFAKGLWVKPGSTTKTKTEHRVPLSAAALQLLADMRARAEAAAKEKGEEISPYLFPGRGTDTPQSELKKFWRRISRDAKLEGVRVHDLRHSFASILVSGGASLPLIGALLGHTQPSTTARYSHLFDDAQRAAAERAAAFVTNAGAGKSAQVVKLPNAG